MLEMRKMLSKKLNKKGFTLAELLVVVAIIAILVAVSIPIFTGRLEKSREATDVANMRAAKGAAVTAILSEEIVDGATWAVGATKATAYYDAEEGVFKAAKAGINGYGQGTTADGGTTYKGYAKGTDYKGKIVKATITLATDAVAITWE